MNMPRKTAAVSVIGAGIIGSWTALHLAEAGISTTLIEQFPLPHTRGSSHGLSRAFRLLGELELGRLDYSLQRWQDLEQACGETLFVKTGLLNFGLPGDTELETYMEVLREGGRPFEWLDAETIAERYPMLNYPPEWGAARDPNGGLLIAHRCLNAVQSRFRALGGRIVTGRVESIDPGEGATVTLHSNIDGRTDTRFFDRAVVCAGPWVLKKLSPKDFGPTATCLAGLLTPVNKE